MLSSAVEALWTFRQVSSVSRHPRLGQHLAEVAEIFIWTESGEDGGKSLENWLTNNTNCVI